MMLQEFLVKWWLLIVYELVYNESENLRGRWFIEVIVVEVNVGVYVFWDLGQYVVVEFDVCVEEVINGVNVVFVFSLFVVEFL